MKLGEVVDFLFPPQCGGCDTPGTGICERCLPCADADVAMLTTLRVHALARYEGGVRRAVLALKSGRRDVAEGLGTRLAALVGSGETLVPVPTTAGRRRGRGFDGCGLLARTVAQRTGAAVLPHLAQIAGDRQRGRARDARLLAQGRFAWRGTSLDGRSVVLLDDVVTTGATLEDCACAIRAAGGRVDKAIVIARA